MAVNLWQSRDLLSPIPPSTGSTLSLTLLSAMDYAISVNAMFKWKPLLPNALNDYKGDENYSNKSRRKHAVCMYLFS